MDQDNAKMLVQELINGLPSGFTYNELQVNLQIKIDPERFREIVTDLRTWALTPSMDDRTDKLSVSIDRLSDVITELTNNIPLD